MALRLIVYLVLGVCIWLPVLCLAQTLQANTIVIKNHQFNPSPLTVPAGRKIEITVDNQDPTDEEFESFDLDREQVVEGNKKIIVFIGPLKPGTYGYWADYHKASKGVIVAQ
jgi:plastocyanin